MINWDDLKVFLAAYREGSIGRAAEALGVSGSTVSRRLSALEDALGQILFVRSPDGLKPTEAGQRAWQDAQEAERSVRRMEGGVGDHDALQGNVRVSVDSSVLCNVLLPRWREFSAAHPNISVEFVDTPSLLDLERWEADLAIRTVRPPDGDNLVITRLRESRMGLFGAQRLLQAWGVEPDDANAMHEASRAHWADWPWVDWTPEFAHLPGAQVRAQLFPDARVVLRLDTLESIRLAASAAVGLALLPTFFGRVSPSLVALPQPHLQSAASLYLVGHRAIRNTGRVRAVWDHLVATLRGTDDDQLQDGRDAITSAYGVSFDPPPGSGLPASPRSASTA